MIIRRLRHTWVSLALIVSPAWSQLAVVEQVRKLEETGKFKEAAAALQKAIAQKSEQLAPSEFKTLEFELDRLKRIKLDYSLTKEKLYRQLEKSIKGTTPREFEQWIAEGRFDRRVIDGVEYFVGVSRSNLFWRYPELNSRRISPSDETQFEQAVWKTCVAIKQAAMKEKSLYVLPKTFRTVMKVTAQPNAAPEGEIIRAWLPIPRAFPHQKNFRLLSSSSPVQHLDDEQSPIRSAYLEQASRKDQRTEFKIEYTYTTYGVHFDLHPNEVQSFSIDDPDLKNFVSEGPHVVFTDKIKKLSGDLAGNKTNPLLKAKKFYDWIAGTIKYSYALEYSTIRNISDYCLTKGYGDCGQAALLFITLCRYNGIPARWQSAWFTFPGGKTIHDWTEIYIRPYGWIPVDPYMGVFAIQYLKSLTPRQKLEVRDFYFGGLDQYRMAANSDHNQTLTPPKRSLRSDNVDFQRGELEFGTTNIYFNQYSFDLTVEEIPGTP